jgi:hypothetical protein
LLQQEVDKKTRAVQTMSAKLEESAEVKKKVLVISDSHLRLTTLAAPGGRSSEGSIAVP